MAVIFVFGLNLVGRHGAGAAREAAQRWGAIYGQGEGRQGNSYGIPTKCAALRTLPLSDIRSHVTRFIDHARAHPSDSFMVTAIGCGLAGYQPGDIAPMFDDIPENVFLSGKLTAAL